jgi:microcystin-dependent protein
VSDPFIGELRTFSFGFAPSGWAFCDGQILSIDQNAALFSLLGTTYGGNGTSTFALPNLQGRVPAHTGSNLTLGEASGEEIHTLQLGEMASHTHVVNASGNPATSSAPTGNVLATATGDLYAAPGPATVSLASPTVTSTGGGQAHENRQPFLVLNICIAMVGIFPSRN